jgi:predicted outer membrane protein
MPSVVVMNVKAPSSASPTSRDAPGWPGGIAPAPLLPGEDEAEYARLTAQFIAAAKPRDFIEEILVRDVIDLSWEILRLRHLKAGLLRVAAGAGVRSVASQVGLGGSVYDFAVKWVSGDAKTRKEFAEILKKAGLGMEDVMAEALSSKIEAFERIDRMLASAEARRNNALREIDRHRSTLGAAVRQAIDKVEDAEFRDVETGEVGGGSPP